MTRGEWILFFSSLVAGGGYALAERKGLILLAVVLLVIWATKITLRENYERAISSHSEDDCGSRDHF